MRLPARISKKSPKLDLQDGMNNRRPSEISQPLNIKDVGDTRMWLSDQLRLHSVMVGSDYSRGINRMSSSPSMNIINSRKNRIAHQYAVNNQ